MNNGRFKAEEKIKRVDICLNVSILQNIINYNVNPSLQIFFFWNIIILNLSSTSNLDTMKIYPLDFVT